MSTVLRIVACSVPLAMEFRIQTSHSQSTTPASPECLVSRRQLTSKG
jgi:hypothetical protein